MLTAQDVTEESMGAAQRKTVAAAAASPLPAVQHRSLDHRRGSLEFGDDPIERARFADGGGEDESKKLLAESSRKIDAASKAERLSLIKDLNRIR